MTTTRLFLVEGELYVYSYMGSNRTTPLLRLVWATDGAHACSLVEAACRKEDPYGDDHEARYLFATEALGVGPTP